MCDPTLFFCSQSGGGMWIPADQLGPVLKHEWFTVRSTESSLNYALYNNRNHVNVYTLRFNLQSPNYTHDTMIDQMIQKVMAHFPKSKEILGNIQYDMLLVSRDDDPSYYLWRANSNQRSSSRSTEETWLQREQHQLYLFGQKAVEVDMAELNIDFQSSGVVISQLLTIVFTFSSV